MKDATGSLPLRPLLVWCKDLWGQCGRSNLHSALENGAYAVRMNSFISKKLIFFGSSSQQTQGYHRKFNHKGISMRFSFRPTHSLKQRFDEKVSTSFAHESGGTSRSDLSCATFHL
jgi:hypothetical protein